MRVIGTTVGLLICSNVFMTFAWYAHLRNLSTRAWYVAAMVSWGIALFEYLLQVPANRIGYTTLTITQLKIVSRIASRAGDTHVAMNSGSLYTSMNAFGGQSRRQDAHGVCVG